MTAAPDLAAPVRAVLRAGEKAKAPEAELASWRRILDLLEQGQLELGEDETPAEAFPPLLAVAHEALTRRVADCRGSDAEERRIGALKRLRDLLLRSAIRAGAAIPSFDQRPSVGLDGAATENERQAA